MKKWLIIAGILVVLLIIAFGGWFLFSRDTFPLTKDKNTSEYSAVFLVNGQVYFGKLGSSHGGYTSLTDIFYLQTDQAVQPTDTTKVTDQSKLTLVKLGNELHGPKDEMRINDNQILFTEDLKTDGQVVKTITSYKKGETTSPTTP